MAEYIVADIGLNFKLAFEIDFVSKIFHSFDSMFEQVAQNSFDLLKIFGSERDKVSFLAVVILKDGSSFLVKNCNFENFSKKKVFPLLPSFFEAEKVWARAVILNGNEIVFVVEPSGLAKVCNG